MRGGRFFRTRAGFRERYFVGMSRCVRSLLVAFACVLSAHAAADPRPFTQTLTNEQKQRLGIAWLTAAELAELDAAVSAYTRGEATVAVQQAVAQVERQAEVKVQQAVQQAQAKVRQAEQQAAVKVQQAVQQVEQQAEAKVQQAEKKAAETAVADYKKKEEPGVIARTLERFKTRQSEDTRERFNARVTGLFRGWQGGTYFPLENGQVWRQVGSESNELKPLPNAEVEIFQSKNGYWRLKYEGEWITVKRLQ